MKSIINRLISGVLSLGIIAFLTFMTIIKRKGEGLPLQRIVVISFPDVEGLKLGNTVFIQGIPFGDVGQITVKEDRVYVNIVFQKEVTFYRDYSIVLKNFSVFGKKAIYINPGRDKYGPVIPGTMLKGKTIENPFDYAAMVLKENKENLRNLLRNVAEITKKIDRSGGTFSILLNNPELYYRVVRTLGSGKNLLGTLEKEYLKVRTEAVTNAVKDAIYQLDK